MVKKKKEKSERRSLTDFLEQEAIEKKKATCFFCREPEVKKEIDDYLDLLASDQTLIKLSRFHDRHLTKVFPSCPKAYSAIKRHITKCLNRSNITGEPLEE